MPRYGKMLFRVSSDVLRHGHNPTSLRACAAGFIFMLHAYLTVFFLRRYVDTAFGTLVLVSPVWRTDHNAVGDHKLFAAMVAMIDFSCAHATLTRVVAERADIVIGCNGLEAEHVAF